MDFYDVHRINSATWFPCAGMVEIGLLVGIRMSSTESFPHRNLVELLDVEFLLTIAVELGSRMICEHSYAGGMELRKVDGSNDSEVIFCTINNVNKITLQSNFSSPLDDWKDQHTKKLSCLLGNYDQHGTKDHRGGSFESVKSVW